MSVTQMKRGACKITQFRTKKTTNIDDYGILIMTIDLDYGQLLDFFKLRTVHNVSRGPVHLIFNKSWSQ